MSSSYPNGAAAWRAIRDRAKVVARREHRRTEDVIDEQVRNVFLQRVFAESGWVLKGGVALLSRVVDARHTLDVDLLSRAGTIEDARAALERAAARDLGDHFRFELAGIRPLVAGEDQQSGVDGYRVNIDGWCGIRKCADLQVDLVVGSLMTQDPDPYVAAPRLDAVDDEPPTFQLYPVVDHLADKVCATETVHGDRPSSRSRDLVDVVILARTHEIDADPLADAIGAERDHRGLPARENFDVPAGWWGGYEKYARTAPACQGLEQFDAGGAYAVAFLDPILTGAAAGLRWIGDAWAVPEGPPLPQGARRRHRDTALLVPSGNTPAT